MISKAGEKPKLVIRIKKCRSKIRREVQFLLSTNSLVFFVNLTQSNYFKLFNFEQEFYSVNYLTSETYNFLCIIILNINSNIIF